MLASSYRPTNEGSSQRSLQSIQMKDFQELHLHF